MDNAVKPLEPKWLFYGLSFFVPVAGIIIGAIYMSKTSEEAKAFGKKCLTAAIIYFVTVCCCVVLYMTFYFGILFTAIGAEGIK